MIPRYEVQDISSLWSDEEKFKYYLQVELAHLQTLEEDGMVAPGTSNKLSNAKINPSRISEIEKTTNHDVIAFCSSITEQFTSDEGRFFHFGMTSSDVIDTAHSLIIRESMNIIFRDLKELKSALRKKAHENSDLLCIGRSHGISAEAMIFGQKFLSFEAELDRRISEWDLFRNSLTGQISGAVGNYTVVSPEQESRTLSKLGLKVEQVSSQVISRDHYACLVGLGALIGSLLERMAIELRLLQHSDIDEVREGFSKGQKGSSTMPHKKNPISSENITGIARLLRSHTIPALENCALWHERDISHSSVERLVLPDHFGLLAYAVRRMRNVVENLIINRERIEKKIKDNEKIFSSYVLHNLISTNPTFKREELYDVVQTAFFSSNSREELERNLSKELNERKIKHSLKDWLDLENLKHHYKSQFLKVMARFP
jgi:adenylosuccinate lyase